MCPYHNDKRYSKMTTNLHQAVMVGDLAKVLNLKRTNYENFIEMLVTPDGNGDLPLDRAAARGHYEIVVILLNEHHISKQAYTINNKQHYTPLLSAVRAYLQIIADNYQKKGDYYAHGIFNIENANADYLAIIKL